MFNIKSIVNKLTERGREPSEESLASRSNDDIVSMRTEGFLCPKCMKQLPSAWELQFHYESVHEEDVSSQLNTHTNSAVAGSEASLESEADCGDQDVSFSDVTNSSLAVEDVPLLTDVQELQELLQQTLNRKATLESRVIYLVQNNVTMKTATEEMNRELFQLRERLKILEAQLAHRESIDDAAVLRQELVQVQRVMDEMNRERERERDNLQAQLLQLQENESVSLIESLKTALQEKEKQFIELSEKLTKLELKNQEDNICANDEKDKSVSREHVIERDASQSVLQQKTEELSLEIAMKKELEEQLSNKTIELAKLQAELVTLQETSVSQSAFFEKMEQQQKELQEKLNKEKVKSMDLSLQLQKQEDAVQLLMRERLQLSQQLESVERAKILESEETSRKLETLKSDLEEKSRNQKLLEDNLLSQTKKCHLLQSELKSLNESSNAAIQSKNEELKALKVQLDEIAGEKLALEAQLESIDIEHQKLLERCYASTNEIESLHHSKAELRRKWEECVSALQEMGRENATLQLDIEKLLGRKWAEDADVTHCTLCEREFKLLLRKHHCRNCGQIFCSECSSKTAAVVSNKKPVRVCNSCFTELRTK